MLLPLFLLERLEEIRGRQLLTVADHDQPVSAHNRAVTVDNFNLAGLVKDDQVKVDEGRRQELRNG